MATTLKVNDKGVKKAPPYHLPDWRNPNEYPSISKTDPVVWAWEFLRRSHIYAKHVKKTLAVAETLRKSGSSYDDLPISLPDNFPSNESLAPWACYPSALPNKKSLAEYESDVGHRPKSAVRRDMLIRLRWGITDPVPPREAKSSDAVRFNVPSHRPTQINFENANQPRNVHLVLMPDEVAVVFDLRRSIESQSKVIENSLRVLRQSAQVAARLDRLRPKTNATPLPNEMWAMLRLADAVREHQRTTGWKRSSLVDEYSSDGFKYKEFLDFIEHEVNRTRDFDSSARQWLTTSLSKTQLRTWRGDHLVRLIYCGGYLSLLPTV